MQATTLRPGLLVSLKTTISGNVSYEKRDIEPEHIEPDGTKKSVWETARTVELPPEHDEAIRVRGKIRSGIAGVCSWSNFGLLCPDNRIDDLDQAIRDGQELAYAYNSQAALTRIGVYVVAGRIAADDVQAVRAINSEVRDLLDTIEGGLSRLDVQAVRDAAKRATQLGRMLSPAAQEKVKDAVAAARGAARQIVKAAEQGGAAEIDQVVLATVRASRTAFLDLEDAGEMQAPEAEGRAIDLVPEQDEKEEEYIPETGTDDYGNPSAPGHTNIPGIDLGAYAGEDDESVPAVPPRTPPAIEWEN